MKTEFSTKRNLRNEFIKSGAMLLLALVLLVTVVLAWFGGPQDVTIDPFIIKVQTETGDTELGAEVVTDRTVILPCATKLGNEEISVVDFSRALKLIPLEVESPLPNNVSISIETVPGLHFYIDTDYDKDTDTALGYAQIITDNYISGTGNDSSREMSYVVPDDYNEEDKVYQHWVNIVYWADFDQVPIDENETQRTIGQIIEEDGLVGLNSTMSFKVIREDSE